MANIYQCQGTTQKGYRCKKTVSIPQGYCIHHNKQQAQQHVPGTFSSTRPNKGYIYLYTMNNFINPPSNWSFKVKNIPNTSTKDKDKWINFKSRKSPYILIKIGMTTQLPNIRIKQWEMKCGHDLINIGPKNENLIKNKNFLERFLCLSIEDREEINYNRFKNDGFYCEENLKLIESTIHQKLRRKYGKGDVYCSGCLQDQEKIKDKQSPFKTNYNVHIEWFLIPKSDLREVHKLIDCTCRSIG
ncbi:uncharacterized protein KGF55_003151 [Candida pseudojiufengensis]|uniref:uncharacterized protein n=1 Tax=Candida pseudojiufengensis TaxID=497109 RepID=UPI0022259184|nr:uncharacterized protein KGF55_003151 [Candida pseudojiufengensis]KAI5962076.1 hypothetical protein KGF55_003151 [Candida pseudojiufengensis]